MSETIQVRSGPLTLERPATLLGARQGAGCLFHVLDPYEHGNVPPPARLALVDEGGVAYRIWYVESAPKWAQRLYRERYEGGERGWPSKCIRCNAVLDTDEGAQTGVCPDCWTWEDGEVSDE